MFFTVVPTHLKIMDSKTFLKEITVILNNENKKYVIEECLQQILPFTGTEENKKAILEQHDLIKILIKLSTPVTYDSKYAWNVKYVAEIFINLSAEEKDATTILRIEYNSSNKITTQSSIIEHCIKHILDPDNELADIYCKLLCNLSRTDQLINHTMNYIPENINQLVGAFSNLEYNNAGCNLDYLAPFMANVTQTTFGVDCLFEHLKQLLNFIEHDNSTTRRYGIVAMVKNITMKHTTHGLLLNESLSILPKLLVLLVDSESKTELMNYLPDIFQSFMYTSAKESEPDIRLMLLEILLKLCNSPEGRDYMRGQGVYEILRELHKNETNEKIFNVCETVVNILLRTEDEIGATYLHELVIPPEIDNEQDEPWTNE